MVKVLSRQVVLGLSILLLLGGAAYWAKEHLLAEPSPAYLTAPVVRMDLQQAVLATGILQAFQQVDVGAQVSGQLKSLKVRLGDRVEKGQLLAEIDPQLSQSALRSATASLASLEAQRRAVAASLWQADLNLRRQQEMIANDATSRQELDAARAQRRVLAANLASFDAQISQARAQVDTATTNLGYTRITAPIDGQVVAVVTQEGQTVVASQQAPVILKLANVDTITVKAQISEADVIHIRNGQPAYFTILGDTRTRHVGTLRAIEPAPQDFNDPDAKAGPVFYNALFEAPNADHRLRIGMTAQVTVVRNEARNALAVPIGALGARGADGRYAVRVVEPDGSLRTVMAAVGLNDRVYVQVTDGLAEGQEVVTAETPGRRD